MVRIIAFLIVCGVLMSYGFEHSKKEGIQNPTKQISTNDTIILWNPLVKLKWKDFQGEVDKNSEYKAMTYVTVEINPIKLTNDTIICDITCWFEKKMSWSKDKQSVALLKHEQLHFDIAELSIRKLRKKFLAYKYLFKDSINPMIDGYVNEAILEKRKLNFLYDSETNHSIIADKQKEWELKIAAELKSLDKYSSSRVMIKKAKSVAANQNKKQ
jgi:hypothetical protein